MFSVYPYMQRNQDDFEFELEDSYAVQIRGTEEDTSDSFVRGSFNARSHAGASSVVSRTPKKFFGFNPIPTDQLNKSLDLIAKFMNNSIHLSTNMVRCPEEFIASDGELLYELLGTLHKMKAPGQIKGKDTGDRAEFIERLIAQYEELLLWLKTQGCLLNTIRPEYLLSHNDYCRYLQMKPSPDAQHLAPKRLT